MPKGFSTEINQFWDLRIDQLWKNLGVSTFVPMWGGMWTLWTEAHPDGGRLILLAARCGSSRESGDREAPFHVLAAFLQHRQDQYAIVSVRLSPWTRTRVRSSELSLVRLVFLLRVMQPLGIMQLTVCSSPR
jgi:hypothetical protein